MTEEPPLDLEHELPSEGIVESTSGPSTSADAPVHSNSLREPTAECENEAAALRERLARLQAEFENARKRALKEQQEFREYALFDAAKAFLPVADSFERALRLSLAESLSLRSGLELIHKQLLDALVKIGVRPIEAKGQRFNPAMHEAIEVIETDLVEDQHVLEELQRGYMFKERLLRPTRVIVSRHRSEQ